MFGDTAAATDCSMAMAVAFHQVQDQGLTPITSYHHRRMLSFQSNPPDPTFMPGPPPPPPPPPPPTTGTNATLFLPPPNPSPLPKYKFVTTNPADWTAHEVATLNQGLLRYAHEPNITKYIKIAAMLPTKTIRDVALRVWWNPGKEDRRSKPGEYCAGKNMTYFKNKMAATASVSNVPMPPPNSSVPFSLSMHHPSQNSLVPMEAVPVLDSATQHLLEENNQLLSQIAANIETFKVEENMDLLVRTHNNIRAILERMRETPGIMGQMCPLPVPVNDDHLNSLLQLQRGGKSDMKLT